MSEPPVSRRRWLGLAAGLGATAALAGCSGLGGPGPRPVREGTRCVPRAALARHTGLADLPLVYEVSGNRTPFWFDPDFAGRLETWLTDLSRIGLRAARLWTYGAWTDGGGDCDSWHDSGRAFDLARIELADGRFLSCRYDQWQTLTGSTLGQAQRQYWALAASLHRRFAYVVTYPYNTDHHNHIHIDNARSGRGSSVFDPRSPTQLQAIQAIARYVWDRPVELTGRWEEATRRATSDVLAEIGSGGELTDAGGWDRYLAASAATATD